MKRSTIMVYLMSLAFGAGFYVAITFADLLFAENMRTIPNSRRVVLALGEEVYSHKKEREASFEPTKGQLRNLSNTGSQTLLHPEIHDQGLELLENVEHQSSEPHVQLQIRPPFHQSSEPHVQLQIRPPFHQLSEPHVQFQIRPPFHFPQPHFSKPDKVLLESEWIPKLHEFLLTVTGRKQVSMVSATLEHQDVLINWLISAYLVANPPLENILVLSLDWDLHDLLESRGVSSLFVSPEMIINPSANITRRFSQVHLVRLNVLRVMLHYGFDVVNYDCDAILLKNPQVIFDKHKHADIIGTFGKGPRNLYLKWGVTLNTGVLLFRSNINVEIYWEAMSRIAEPTTDDQGNVNLAFLFLNMNWMNLHPSDNIDQIEHELYGVCDHHIIVMLLPFNVICRHTCTASRRKEYYVWHALAIKENRTVENKVYQARIGSAWFLRADWWDVSQERLDLTGVRWLQFLRESEAQADNSKWR